MFICLSLLFSLFLISSTQSLSKEEIAALIHSGFLVPTLTYSSSSTASPLVDTVTANGSSSIVMMMPALPLFLQEADDAARREYFDLHNNPNLQIRIIRLATNAWATKQGGSVQSSYAAYTAGQEAEEVAREAKVAAAVLKLSARAQEAHSLIDSAMKNENQTESQRQTQVNAILASYPKRVIKELEKAVKNI